MHLLHHLLQTRQNHYVTWKETVIKKEVTGCCTHQACRHNGRCLGHPGRNHHSGMDGTRTHSRLSHSVALWSPACSYMQMSLACWHRCRRAHMEIPAHTHQCPRCSPLPCSRLHMSKCKSHWWGLCHRLHQHGMGSTCRHHPDGRAALWHTDKYSCIYLAHARFLKLQSSGMWHTV